jgi:medium-chain acyl-[acyl-carrier-protein] hydrolase
MFINDSWLIIRKRMPTAHLRLFCFPYAGGSAAIYQAWPDFFPSFIEVCCVQLPGRGGKIKEKAFTKLLPLVEATAAEISRMMDRPFAFFGHSMGALIAFELARYLRRNGLPAPVYLFVSGRDAPSFDREQPHTYLLPDAEFVQELKRLNGTPAEALESQELMRLLCPLLRADFELTQTYTYYPEPPLACPITVFTGAEDNEVSVENLAGWQKETTRPISSHVFPGDHFFLHRAYPSMTDIIRKDLASVCCLE